jgi:hypothetical protein
MLPLRDIGLWSHFVSCVINAVVMATIMISCTEQVSRGADGGHENLKPQSQSSKERYRALPVPLGC